MTSVNGLGENMMLKMKKKNYIQERKSNFYMDNEIASMRSGGAVIPIVEELWRGKTQSG